MELRFGEVRNKYTMEGVEVEEVRKIRDYMTAQSIRSFYNLIESIDLYRSQTRV